MARQAEPRSGGAGGGASGSRRALGALALAIVLALALGLTLRSAERGAEPSPQRPQRAPSASSAPPEHRERPAERPAEPAAPRAPAPPFEYLRTPLAERLPEGWAPSAEGEERWRQSVLGLPLAQALALAAERGFTRDPASTFPRLHSAPLKVDLHAMDGGLTALEVGVIIDPAFPEQESGSSADLMMAGALIGGEAAALRPMPPGASGEGAGDGWPSEGEWALEGGLRARYHLTRTADGGWSALRVELLPRR